MSGGLRRRPVGTSLVFDPLLDPGIPAMTAGDGMKGRTPFPVVLAEIFAGPADPLVRFYELLYHIESPLF